MSSLSEDGEGDGELCLKPVTWRDRVQAEDQCVSGYNLPVKCRLGVGEGGGGWGRAGQYSSWLSG